MISGGGYVRTSRHAKTLPPEVVVVQVQDMSLNEQDGKLVACSCNNSFVGVWVVELNKIKPFSGPAVRPTPSQPGEHCMFV